MTPTAGQEPPMHEAFPAGAGRGQAGSFGDRLAVLLAAALAVCPAAACRKSDRPALGRVSGTVTLDRAPLPAALIVFTPDGPGRSSQGVTDDAGRYRLTFLRDIAGASLGRHSVRITTATEDRGGVESLPARYHATSDLVATVVAGDNTIDFPLQSK